MIEEPDNLENVAPRKPAELIVSYLRCVVDIIIITMLSGFCIYYFLYRIHVKNELKIGYSTLCGMLSQSRRQRPRLQRCRIYPQVGDKSHWNSRERVLEPEELSFLQVTDSDTETREGAKRAPEGASPLTYAWANTSLTLAPHCSAFT